MGSRRIRQQEPNEMVGLHNFYNTQDYFIFCKNYPFELLTNHVIGRPLVNNAVMYLAHSMGSHIVDFSQIECFKEDGEEVICSDCSNKDLHWNARLGKIRTIRKYGSIASNFYIRLRNQESSSILFSSKVREKEFQTFENIPDNYWLYYGFLVFYIKHNSKRLLCTGLCNLDIGTNFKMRIYTGSDRTLNEL